MLQAIGWVLSGFGQFVVSLLSGWRILLPAAVGGAFGWWLAGWLIAHSQGPLGFEALGVSPGMVKLLGGVVGAIAATVQFNAWLARVSRLVPPTQTRG